MLSLALTWEIIFTLALISLVSLISLLSSSHVHFFLSVVNCSSGLPSSAVPSSDFYSLKLTFSRMKKTSGVGLLDPKHQYSAVIQQFLEIEHLAFWDGSPWISVSSEKVF